MQLSKVFRDFVERCRAPRGAHHDQVHQAEQGRASPVGACDRSNREMRVEPEGINLISFLNRISTDGIKDYKLYLNTHMFCVDIS